MRLFPRAAPRRLAAASVACVLAHRRAVRPARARRDDLKDRQKQVEQPDPRRPATTSTSRARGCAGPPAASQATQADYDRARSALDAARSRLDAAPAARRRQMQAKLQAAVERLSRAQTDLVPGPAGRRRPAASRSPTPSPRSTRRATPQLIAFTSLLDSQTPEDLTRQAEARNVVVGRETRAYDEPARRRGAPQGPRGRGAAGPRRRRGPAPGGRRAPRRHARARRPDAGAPSARCSERLAVRRSAVAEARRARQRDSAVLAQLQPAREQDPRADPRRRRGAPRASARHGHAVGYRGRTGGLLDYPVAGPRHLAVRLPDAPDLPLLGPARRHRLRRRLRHSRCTPSPAAG